MDAAAYETFARNERDHFWFVGRRAIFFDLLQRLAAKSLPEHSRVLDLGCGVGGMLQPLSKYGAVVGMDLDRGSVGFCRQRGFPDVLRAKGNHLPFADESFGLVGAFDVIEHIPEDTETMAECHRVLAPGGFLIVSGPAYQCLFTHQDRMVHHQRRYTVSELKQKLAQAGFEIEKASYINLFLFPLILPVIMMKKIREKIRPPSDQETRFNTDLKFPKIVNRIFAWLFSAERHLLRFMSFPTGHSLVVLARKPKEPQ
ncbi:MAG: class I SAM-dependent methyltransferase [Planctomycetes bacterium]|nr:class I SAM-dependent methyltransferase [Planctomycetota bacterium]